MPQSWRRSIAVAATVIFAAIAAHAQPPSREQCETAYPAALGRPGKDAPWVPTSKAVALAMLSMAQVTPQDHLLDLGAGDGRIAITAADAPFGARSVGIEYDPELAKLASCLVQAAGVADRVRIVEGDIFKEDLGDPSVVTMFLLPQLNLCVRHRLLSMKPGTRLVSHQYGMADWQPERSVEIQGRNVYLWTVSARVDGVWDFRDSEDNTFTVDLHQTFSALSGQIVRDGVRGALSSATLKGAELRFAFGAAGSAARFSGTVRGNEITGIVSAGAAARTAVGRLRGGLREMPWAAMAPGCSRYYGK